MDYKKIRPALCLWRHGVALRFDGLWYYSPVQGVRGKTEISCWVVAACCELILREMEKHLALGYIFRKRSDTRRSPRPLRHLANT